MVVSNETFAILTIIAVGAVMSLTSGILYMIIVWLDPAPAEHIESDAGRSFDALTDQSIRETIARQLKENAVTTSRIVRDARHLADQIEGLSKAMTSKM